MSLILGGHRQMDKIPDGQTDMNSLKRLYFIANMIPVSWWWHIVGCNGKISNVSPKFQSEMRTPQTSAVQSTSAQCHMHRQGQNYYLIFMLWTFSFCPFKMSQSVNITSLISLEWWKQAVPSHPQPSAVGMGTQQRVVLHASVHTVIYCNFHHPPTRRRVTTHFSLPV